MVIGLDIDNVITAFDSAILQAFLREDKNKRGKGIVDKNADHVISMFDWSQEEIDNFFAENMENLAKTLRVRKNCKKYMDKLLEDGHELYFETVFTDLAMHGEKFVLSRKYLKETYHKIVK